MDSDLIPIPISVSGSESGLANPVSESVSKMTFLMGTNLALKAVLRIGDVYPGS